MILSLMDNENPVLNSFHIEGTESEKESEAESEVQQDSNVPEGYQGIYQVSDLSRLSEKPDGKYILMNDLDLASAEWQGSIPVFRGTLDGGNHQIKGLKTALIQVLEEGTICNLSLVDVEISHSGDTGALADTIGTGKKASVRIQNVSITGNVSGTGNTGALAGLVKGTDIQFEGIANSAKINGGANSGGLIGMLEAEDDQEEEADVLFTSSYNVGEVSGTEMGGLIGAVDIPDGKSVRNVKIENCYNAGVLTRGGNLVGRVTVYWYSDVLFRSSGHGWKCRRCRRKQSDISLCPVRLLLLQHEPGLCLFRWNLYHRDSDRFE